MRANRILKLASVALISALALSACIVVPANRRVAYAEPAYGPPIAVADIPPPAMYREDVPVAPFVDALWIGGYWGWSGGRHVWVGGHYEHSRPGYGWRPHTWVQANGHWHLHEGGWVRR